MPLRQCLLYWFFHVLAWFSAVSGYSWPLTFTGQPWRGCDPAVVRCAAVLVLLMVGSNVRLAAGPMALALISWRSLCGMILSVELPGGMLQAAGCTGEQGTCLGKSRHGQTLVLLWFPMWAFLYWRLKGKVSQTWLQDDSVLPHGVKQHSLLWIQRRALWSLLPRDVVTKLHQISKASQDLETTSNQQPPHHHPISSKNNDNNEGYFVSRIPAWFGLEGVSEGHLVPTLLPLVGASLIGPYPQSLQWSPCESLSALLVPQFSSLLRLINGVKFKTGPSWMYKRMKAETVALVCLPQIWLSGHLTQEASTTSHYSSGCLSCSVCFALDFVCFYFFVFPEIL